MQQPRHTSDEVARRAGVEPDYLAHLVDLGILSPGGPDGFSPGDVRRVLLASSLEDAGIPLDAVAEALLRGALSLDFLDAASYERFAALAAESFQQVSDRTGIPLELLTVIREAMGSAQPSPDDRMREDELTVVPFIELQVTAGFRPVAIERLLRVRGRRRDDRCQGGAVRSARRDPPRRATHPSTVGFASRRQARVRRAEWSGVRRNWFAKPGRPRPQRMQGVRFYASVRDP